MCVDVASVVIVYWVCGVSVSLVWSLCAVCVPVQVVDAETDISYWQRELRIQQDHFVAESERQRAETKVLQVTMSQPDCFL